MGGGWGAGMRTVLSMISWYSKRSGSCDDISRELWFISPSQSRLHILKTIKSITDTIKNMQIIILSYYSTEYRYTIYEHIICIHMYIRDISHLLQIQQNKKIS